MKISILLAAYKSEEMLKKVFLPSLHDIKCEWQLIICDNGGNGNLTEILQPYVDKYNDKEYFSFKIVGEGDNIGLNAGLNKCAKVADGEFFYLPHTDMRMMPGCLEALLGAAKNQAPSTFIFSSRSIEKSSHIPMQLIKDFGTNLENFKEKELYEFFSTYKDRGIVTGCRMPMFLDKKLWNKMNGVDEQFFSYATDNDIFFSAYEKNVRKFWIVNESIVYHLSGHSNKQQVVDKDDKTPYIRLCEKWKKYNVTMNIDQSEQALIPWNLKIR